MRESVASADWLFTSPQKELLPQEQLPESRFPRLGVFLSFAVQHIRPTLSPSFQLLRKLLFRLTLSGAHADTSQLPAQWCPLRPPSTFHLWINVWPASFLFCMRLSTCTTQHLLISPAHGNLPTEQLLLLTPFRLLPTSTPSSKMKLSSPS